MGLLKLKTRLGQSRGRLSYAEERVKQLMCGWEDFKAPPTCLVILLCFSFSPLPCYCSLKSSIADAVNSLFSLPHIWTSDHQLHLSLVHILPVWDASWAIYELNVTEVCKLYSRVPSKLLLQLSEKGEWDMASSHYPSYQNVTSHMVLRLDRSPAQTNHFFKDEHDN